MMEKMEKGDKVEDSQGDSSCYPKQPRSVSGEQGPTQLAEGSFKHLRMASQTVLEELMKRGRSKCPKCQASRMFYCYTCFSLLEGISEERVPRVKLPLKVDIIKHSCETDGKSTAVHACILAPDDVTMYTYPCFPEYDKNEKAVKKIKLAGDKEEHCTPVPSLPPKVPADSAKRYPEGPFHRVVFIDSTWNQTNKMSMDERLKALQCVKLQAWESQFWRHQKGTPRTFLSTIEAIYYFFVEYHGLLQQGPYAGQHDNLLFFFTFMHGLVNNAKAHKQASLQA
ncbi:tRNA-uridine aminocarboxypropyltransferase 1 isoform X2 [Lethenteron reissneri]|uniref:tRNA-uridine aminocarboxypropyltransferase 1 isoform X2 n=1 Tax=Lethenteron reissneri TaxID=7753 RepID=UPI002AB65C7B|nr:tRNA-uridine aminocarboxypropyltransferase 1 isoform X2 [Lethenteron reissneri]